MERRELVNNLKALNPLELTLLDRKRRLLEDIEYMRAKMEGKAIQYDKLNVVESIHCTDKLEEYSDRIIMAENEIKNIGKSLKKIEMIRNALYVLPMDEQNLIIAYYINGQKSSDIGTRMFYCRQTIIRRLNIAIDHLLTVINCTECTHSNVA